MLKITGNLAEQHIVGTISFFFWQLFHIYIFPSLLIFIDIGLKQLSIYTVQSRVYAVEIVMYRFFAATNEVFLDSRRCALVAYTGSARVDGNKAKKNTINL